MGRLAPTILGTPHSGIRRMYDRARREPDCIMLVSGDPNFTTPDHIIDSAAQAARNGATGYAPGGGLDRLREAIAEKVQTVNRFACEVDNVCVTTGGCGGLFTTLLLILEPGDEVLVPDPGWSNYPAMAHVLRATGVPYSLDIDAGCSIDPERIVDRITDRTRAIIVNSPSNPAGSVETAERLRTVVEIAEQHDLWVISDECYDALVFEGNHTSAAALDGSSRVITVFTFSKTYAMTGWRVGYVTAPSSFARQLSLHQEPVVSCASTVSQHAALAALAGPQDCVSVMRDAYRERRDLAGAELDALGVPYISPRGGFFLMVRISDVSDDSWTFSHALLEERAVAVVPGAAFGTQGEGFVRLSLAAASSDIEMGTRRLAAFIAESRR